MMRVLGASSRLTELSLSRNPVGTALVHGGLFGGSLQVLELCGISWKNASSSVPQVARILEGSTALQHLDLRHNNLDGHCLAVMFAGLSRPCTLRRLCLSDNKLNSGGVAVLVHAQAVLKHLVEVEMDWCGIANHDAKRNRQAEAGEPRTKGLARAREEHAVPARHAHRKKVIRELVKGKHAGFLVRGRNGRGKIGQRFVLYRHN